MIAARYEWDDNKDAENQGKHQVSFREAQAAFADPHRVIARFGAQWDGRAVLLYWQGRGWHSHGSLHVSAKSHSDYWGGLLAQRKGCL